MALFLVTPPATEPLTVAEAKAHCRIDSGNAEPAPTAITVALGSGAGSVDNGAHRYLATFVTADGETDAGLVSAAVTVVDKTLNGKTSLSAIPIGGSAVTARKLYRTIAAGATYLLLATIADNVTTIYTDTIADASLGAQAPTTNTTADPELGTWITAARQFVETYTHRQLITATWDLKLDDFPSWSSASRWGAIMLPLPPTQSITSITYLDFNGVSQTWSASLYDTDLPTGPHASPGRVLPGYQQIYPVTRMVPAAVTVRFVAGYGTAASVPAGIKAAMKLLVGNWYKNREAGQIVRGSADILPFGVAELLWTFKAFA